MLVASFTSPSCDLRVSLARVADGGRSTPVAGTLAVVPHALQRIHGGDGGFPGPRYGHHPLPVDSDPSTSRYMKKGTRTRCISFCCRAMMPSSGARRHRYTKVREKKE